MRHSDYFIAKACEITGFRWSVGISKKCSGVKVRQRYLQAGFWQAYLLAPSINELTSFTGPRFPGTVLQAAEGTPAQSLLRPGFPRGTFFRMLLLEAIANRSRYWHGSNLYVINSAVRNGLRNQTADHGPRGVFCFSDTRAHKVSSYCYYILSGSGCAWTVIAELAIDPYRTRKFSVDQTFADEADVALVALWFHGVSQNEFNCEYIWPLWEPSLEVPTSGPTTSVSSTDAPWVTPV